VKNAYTNSVVRREGKRPSGRPRTRWENNITTELKETWPCIRLAGDAEQQRTVVKAVLYLWFRKRRGMSLAKEGI
jgi:hypothetical protein